jgi:hypothetical protein
VEVLGHLPLSGINEGDYDLGVHQDHLYKLRRSLDAMYLESATRKYVTWQPDAYGGYCV